jgi:hypothetical protein
VIGISSFGVLDYYAIANAAAFTQLAADRLRSRWLNVLGAAGASLWSPHCPGSPYSPDSPCSVPASSAARGATAGAGWLDDPNAFQIVQAP